MASITPRNKPPQHRARYIADAAKHGGRESFDAGNKSHIEVDALGTEQAVDHAGGPGQETADAEGEHDHPINIDAHQTGDFLVFRDGAHGFADATALDKPIQAEHQDQRRAKDKDLRDGNVDAADANRALQRLHARVSFEARTVETAKGIL